ncbi:lymphocyte function-associated antigen 3 isoform X4 [Myotis lucifugus]|uniref:lymphocyte function-associated antigen 3 isoform X4 n=1 Tax=Myotis lucifugus TaxID=59463 RepID=UPI000CCC5E13|nr:lymphocyte function-associated antigen 3 isoform X4 [Myotis lucifugus]
MAFELGLWGPQACGCAVIGRAGFISCQLMRFGSIGGNITLSPSSTVNFTEIIWKKGKDKVTEWSTNFNVTTYSLLEGRVHLDPKSGDLTISNLTSSDEGEYEMKSMDLTDSSKFHLTVLDPLRSPTLNCTVTNEIISVHCKMPQSYRRHRELLRYAWHCPFPQCEGSWELEAPVLNFTKEGDLSREVRCFVKNQESNRTSSIVLSTCVPSDNSRHRYALTAVPFAVIVCAVAPDDEMKSSVTNWKQLKIPLQYYTVFQNLHSYLNW